MQFNIQQRTEHDIIFTIFISPNEFLLGVWSYQNVLY